MSVGLDLRNIDSLIMYLSSGFIFVKIYLFARNSNDEAKWNSYYIVPSIVISYVLKQITDCLFDEIGLCIADHWFGIVLLLEGLCLGLSIGKLASTQLANRLIVRLFKHGSYTDFWSEAFDENKYYIIKYKNKENLYVGLINLIESDQRYPLIRLYRYYIFDEPTDKVLEDNRDSPSEIIISTEDIQYIKMESTTDKP